MKRTRKPKSLLFKSSGCDIEPSIRKKTLIPIPPTPSVIANQEKYKEYDGVDYGGVIYKIDDIVKTLTIENQTKRIGKIKKIIREYEEEDNLQIYIEIFWFYNLDNLPLKFKNLPYLSSYEVFPPTIEENEKIKLSYIETKVNVVSQLEFEKFEDIIPLKTFFTRAKYDVKKKKFDPNPQEWKTICVCKSPWNPNSPYIQCETCNKWYHFNCVNINESDAANIQFLCPECLKK